MPGTVALKSGQLVFGDELGVVKQAADQGGLAVIDRTAGKEAKKRFVFLVTKIFCQGVGRIGGMRGAIHQK